jgi:hypothetical protein
MAKIDSQWAAQFAVAAELVRRGYSATFYLGNEPLHDMPVRGRTSGNHFVLQIKGTENGPPRNPQAAGPDILVGNLNAGKLSDIFIIVYAPFVPYASGGNPSKAFRFFIATRQELQAVKNPGKPYPKFTSDWVKYGGIYPFEDSWDKLPAP